MSRSTVEPLGSRIADGMDLPRPQLAAALAVALRRTTVVEHVVAAAAGALPADLALCEQLARLPGQQRVALRRAESAAIDAVGIGVAPGSAHLVALDGGQRVLLAHGDGWSLVGRTRSTLLFLLDVAPGLVIDRSHADGATELITGLAEHLDAGRRSG